MDDDVCTVALISFCIRSVYSRLHTHRPLDPTVNYNSVTYLKDMIPKNYIQNTILIPLIYEIRRDKTYIHDDI